MRLPCPASPALFILALAPAALGQSIVKLNTSASGVPTNGSVLPSLADSGVSPDGRFVLLECTATNLEPGDTNGGAMDLYVHDVVTGARRRVTESASGVQANDSSFDGSLSDDGRFVAFSSVATNLIPGIAPSWSNIYRKDTLTGAIVLVSVRMSGGPASGIIASPSISGDGTKVAFSSDDPYLVVGDTNGKADVFVRDVVAGTTIRVSSALDGVPGFSGATFPAISGDGAFVVFRAVSPVPHPAVPSGTLQSVLCDITQGTLTVASVNDQGVPSNLPSQYSSISRDGSRVAFITAATNLGVPGASTRLAYVREPGPGITRLVSVRPDGALPNAAIEQARISDNGRFVLLLSLASNLTTGSGSPAKFDAFVAEVDTLRTIRASRPLVEPGEPNNSGASFMGGVSDDGSRAVFGSNSTNLMPGEPINTILDTYLAQPYTDWYQDLDGDGFGVASVVSQGGFQLGAGWSFETGDCDDADPAVYPGALETCNGIDDDCDGVADDVLAEDYCSAGTSVAGCTPLISASGIPSISAGVGLVIAATGLPGQRNALVVYGLAPAQITYAGGSSAICTAAPRQRTTVLSTGGSQGQCDGSCSLDWLAYMGSHPGALGHPLQAGTAIYAQVWYRDSGAPLNSNLTAGLRFALCP